MRKLIGKMQTKTAHTNNVVVDKLNRSTDETFQEVCFSFISGLYEIDVPREQKSPLS